MPRCGQPQVEPRVGPERRLPFSLGIVSKQFFVSPKFSLLCQGFYPLNYKLKILPEMLTHWLKSCEWRMHVLAQKGGIICMHVKENLQDNFWLVNLKLASVVHMLSSQSSIFIWYFVILTGLENGSLVLPRYLDLVRTLYGLIFMTQMCWQTENTLGQMASSRRYYSINRNL